MKQFGLIFIFVLLLIAPAFGQSVNQDFPSPVLQNEISGEIAARDIGDARLTRHFYTFYANVGDLVLDVETRNFNGDVDLFEASTFRPLAKIQIYENGDAAATTNRTVYFRQRRQIVMRIEGRTPNDEPARYRISFSGTFAAGTDLSQPPEDLIPKAAAKTSAEAVARVNSAGAIIEDLSAKKQPEITAEKATTEPAAETEKPAAEAKSATENTTKTTARVRPTPRAARSKTPRRTAPPKTETPSETAETKPETTETATPAEPAPRARRGSNSTTRRNSAKQPAKTARSEEPKVDPLANIRLVVVLKNGETFERSMSDVFRASVDKGTLVVITKDGKIQNFSLLDVQKFSIEQ